MGIIVLGAGLRFWGLGDYPYPVNGDEKAFAYYSWSIANFGTDEYGNKFPLYFPSIGDYKYPAYVYLNIPFVWLFGVSPFSTRFLSAIAGIGLIIMIYKLTKLLINKNIGLVAALMVAISPWDITFSRTASEAHLMTLLNIIGIYFLSCFLLKKQRWWYLIAALGFWGTASMAYSASRIFIPGFLGLLLVFEVLLNQGKRWPLLVELLLIMTVFEGLLLVNPESRVRANNVSMFTQDKNRKEWISNSATMMGIDNPPPIVVTRMFFNKPVAFVYEYIGRYLSHFSPSYLFVAGDVVRLNSINNFGNFYLIEIVFLVIGLAKLINKPTYGSVIIFTFLLAGPLAAAGSVETPSAVRHLIGMPGLLMITATGLWWLVSRIKLIIWPIGLVYIYFVLLLVVSIFKIKPYYQPWSTDQGNQEMVELVWRLKDKYKYVFLPNDPYIDFLFYKKISPGEFVNNSVIKPAALGEWNRVESFQNVIFKSTNKCPKIGQVGALYVCNGLEVPRSAKVLEVIRFKDKVPNFVLLEFEAMSREQQATIPLASHLKYMVEGDGRYPLGIFPEKDRYL